MVIPFEINNSPAIFSRIVVVSFKKFIHKFLEVYFNDWMVFGFIKNHIKRLRMMLEHCRQYQISPNSKKCIFCAPFGIRLAHVIFCNGILVDPKNIVIIVNLPPSTIVNQLRETLGRPDTIENLSKDMWR